MSEQTEPTKRAAERVLVTTGEGMSKRVQEVHDLIACRAFAIFERNGRVFGRDLDDWFQAESELLCPVRVNVSDSRNALTVRAELPGFNTNEIDVDAWPRCLTIAAKRENEKGRTAKGTAGLLLRVVDLPADIDTDKVNASLDDGVLEVTLPKAIAAEECGVAYADG